MKTEVRRGRKFVEYHDPDTQDEHTFTQEISGADVSYQDEQGRWLATDENWAADGLDGYLFKNDKLNHKVRLKGTGGRAWYPRRNVTTEYLTFGVPQYRSGTKWLTFGFNGYSVEGKVITLNTKQGVTIKVYSRRNGIKIDWVLASSSAPVRMRYAVTLTGITEVSGVLFGADGTQLASLTPTTATDANGAVLPCIGSYAGGYVEFQADVTGAVFPVVIDPDFSVQPDATDGMDTRLISSAATSNFGTNNELNAGEYKSGTNDIRRSLIKFNLSSIPSGATLDSVTLSLWTIAAGSTYANNNRTIRVYRTKRNWVESQATWNVYSTGNSWSAAGGFHTDDCEQTAIGSADLTTSIAANAQVDFTLTPTLISDLDLGYGWLIKADTETDDLYAFKSSDHATASNRPKLSITYTLASGIPKHFLHYARQRGN